MKMKNSYITHNVNLLYFIFLLSILNILWFVYYNQRCILIFICISLAIYLINKNMIFVLGISLLLVDSFYLLNLVKKEGFWGDKMYSLEGFNNKNDKYQLDDIDENEENEENDKDVSNNVINTSKSDVITNDSESILKLFLNNSIENKNEKEEFEDDEESNYMHDKSIIKKLKQLNPIILNTIENMNSLHIKEINKTINELTNKVDA